MRLVRRIMGWIFAISSLLVVWGGFLFFAQTFQVQRQYAFSKPRILVVDAIFPVLFIVFGVAWWATSKALPSAKVWGMAASLTYVLISLWQFTHGSQSDWAVPGAEFMIGAVGLVAFSPRLRWKSAAEETEPEDDPS